GEPAELCLVIDIEHVQEIVIHIQADKLMGEVVIFPFLNVGETEGEGIHEAAGELGSDNQIIGVVSLVIGHVATPEEAQIEVVQKTVVELEAVHQGSAGGGRDKLATKPEVEIVEDVPLLQIGVVKTA